MQIKYSEYHPDPNLRNVVRSIDNASGRAAIGSGLAVEVPYKTYQARLSAEGQQQTAGSFQNVSVDEEWGFDGSCTQFRRAVIIFKHGSETTIFDGPTKDTPPSIVKQFRDATQPIVNPEWAEELREREKNKQLEQQSKERAMSAAIVYGRK